MAKIKSLLNFNSTNFLYQYLNNPSPTGFESSGQKYGLITLNPMLTPILLTLMAP